MTQSLNNSNRVFTHYDGTSGHATFSDIPAQAIAECSAQGDCAEAVAYWLPTAKQEMPLVQMAEILKDYGIDGVSEMDSDSVRQYMFWIACGDLAEQGVLTQDA